MRLHLFAALALLSAPAFSQGLFDHAPKPGDPTCPRVVRETDSLNRGGRNAGATQDIVRHYQQGTQFFPLGQRRSVKAFGVLDDKGKSTSIEQLKGKIVLVGFWSVNCEPSANLLLELADLYDKREKFGFEILTVNFDENRPDENRVGGLQAVMRFKQRNPSYFAKSTLPMYVPSLGAQGASNFMENVESLPLLCVVDREGNLASMTIGYTPNYAVENLKRVLVEKPPVAAQPAPKPAPSPEQK